MTAGELFEKLQHYSNWKDLELAVRKYDDGQASPYVTVKVESASKGSDWQRNQIVLYPEFDLCTKEVK